MNIVELKEKSDDIAICDDRIREIKTQLKNLEDELKNVTAKKDQKVWQLQDMIDSISENKNSKKSGGSFVIVE